MLVIDFVDMQVTHVFVFPAENYGCPSFRRSVSSALINKMGSYERKIMLRSQGQWIIQMRQMLIAATSL